tara:strand:+ start:2862 stop:3905 length:1044 start_codon:yes stop_codon:yes gene_type:complete
MSTNSFVQFFFQNNIFIIIFLLNIILFFFHEKISSIFKVYDLPSTERKIHKIPVPSIGGFYFLINFILLIFVNYNFELEIILNFTRREILSITLILIAIFIFGFVDDKYDINANQNLIINLSILYIFVSFNEVIVIDVLRFSFLQNDVYLGNFSVFFTVLSILLFSNAMNMFDGSNCQALTYFIFISLLFVIINPDFKFLLFLLPVYTILYFLNFSNKLFLGNSGIYSISFLFSVFFIKNYIAFKFQADEIFLLMIIPGLELIRLFFFRVFSGKHPFKGDKNHLHHLMIELFGTNKTLFFLTTLILTPIVFFKVNIPILVSIILIVIGYSCLVFFLKVSLKKKLTSN